MKKGNQGKFTMSENTQELKQELVIPFEILGPNLMNDLIHLCSENFVGKTISDDTYIQSIESVKIERPGQISRTTCHTKLHVLLTVKTMTITKGQVFEATVINVDQWGIMVQINKHVRCLIIKVSKSVPKKYAKDSNIKVKITNVKPEEKRLSCTGIIA